MVSKSSSTGGFALVNCCTSFSLKVQNLKYNKYKKIYICIHFFNNYNDAEVDNKNIQIYLTGLQSYVIQ